MVFDDFCTIVVVNFGNGFLLDESNIGAFGELEWSARCHDGIASWPAVHEL